MTTIQLEQNINFWSFLANNIYGSLDKKRVFKCYS